MFQPIGASTYPNTTIFLRVDNPGEGFKIGT